jgi:flagellin
MSVVINTNYAATVAANNLSASNTNLQRSLNRLSSGSKIVSPSDDAGGLAVSMKFSAAIRRQGAQIANAGNQVSFLQTQDGALKVAGKVLERMSELTALAADSTKGSDDTANYGVEFDALKTQLGSIGGATFNGIALFASGGADLDTAVSGIGASDAVTTSGIDAKVQTAIKEVASLRAENGASQSNIGFAAELLTVNKANLEAANSRIVDVDVAEESTQLARWNILVQSGTAMLAQANQSAQVALRLLQ